MTPIPQWRRAQLLADLERLWLRAPDLRFGQLVRTACEAPVRVAADVTEEKLCAGMKRLLDEWPDRGLPAGPYWDTEPNEGSFLHGRPRDPARVPDVIRAFGLAWRANPNLSPGRLLDLALKRAGCPENEFGTCSVLSRTGRSNEASSG